MGAFSIAFDIIIVGALALPWVLLVIHLFFSGNVSRVKSLLQWVVQQNQPAVAGVLLFAMTYALGSVVSRIAQDFFDDDDLHIHVLNHLYRVGVTESSIRTDVYCSTLKRDTAPKPGDPATGKPNPSEDKNPDCKYAGRWIVPARDPETSNQITAEWINDQQDSARYIFAVHEATLLLKGTDPTERLRQFHDQIVVLRGGAFNGMVTFSLCLFWWLSRFQSGLRWTVLLLYLFPAIVASVNHFGNHAHDPPYMEFTLWILAAAGACLLWQRRRKTGQPRAGNGLGEIRFVYVLLPLFLTVSVFLGWWATQVLYDEQVIYSYRAQKDAPAETAKPNPK
jgi:hypothetical protein